MGSPYIYIYIQYTFVPTLNVGTWLCKATRSYPLRRTISGRRLYLFPNWALSEWRPSTGWHIHQRSSSCKTATALEQLVTAGMIIEKLRVRGTKYVNQLSHLVTCQSLQVLCDLESRTHWDGCLRWCLECKLRYWNTCWRRSQSQREPHAAQKLRDICQQVEGGWKKLQKHYKNIENVINARIWGKVEPSNAL